MRAVARLPSERFLIQQIGGDVVLYEEGTEEEVIRVPLYVKVGDHVQVNADGMARAQHVIHESRDLSAEDKCFAHFWSGYFYAHAARGVTL